MPVPQVIPNHEQAVPVCFEGVAEDVGIGVIFREGCEEAVEEEFAAGSQGFVFVEGCHVDFVHVENGESAVAGMGEEGSD